jgi:hypothetical protein
MRDHEPEQDGDADLLTAEAAPDFDPVEARRMLG